MLFRSTQPMAPQEDPRSVVYDPYAIYYPSPMSTVLDFMLISSFMHMMAPPPAIMVVHPSGVPIGSADMIASHPEAVEASAIDPGDAAGDAHGGHDGDTGDHSDGGGSHDALADDAGVDDGGDFGDDGGGDDGGGFDGGGFGGDDY